MPDVIDLEVKRAARRQAIEPKREAVTDAKLDHAFDAVLAAFVRELEQELKRSS